MVRLSGVCKSYPNQSRILDHVNLEVKKGDFLYLIGGSGAGKTSLLRILATEETPTLGSLNLFGYDPAQVGALTLRAMRRSLGYIPQSIRLISDLTVYDNILLSVGVSQRSIFSSFVSKEIKTKALDLMEALGLHKKAHELASRLSGGEAQRVAVARALIRTPDLILADEPTGAQDRDYKWAVMDLFLKANRGGASVIVATHDREIVKRVRKPCALLQQGSVVLEEAACIY